MEIWRLCVGKVVAVCTIGLDTTGRMAVTVQHNAATHSTASFMTLTEAQEHAEALRRQYVADGWSGVFDR